MLCWSSGTSCRGRRIARTRRRGCDHKTDKGKFSCREREWERGQEKEKKNKEKRKGREISRENERIIDRIAKVCNFT